MEHIQLIDSVGKILFSRLNNECLTQCKAKSTEKPERCTVSGEARKRSIKICEAGTVFLCTDDPDLLKSQREFNSRIAFYSEMLGTFSSLREEAQEKINTDNRRLVHNLTTLNSHILQEVYDLVSQEDLTGDPARQIRLIKESLIKAPDFAAAGILRILKNAVAARTEMQIVKWLHPGENPPELSPKIHVIHRVVTNSLITFFQDGLEAKITFLLSSSVHKAFFDYQTVSAALQRMFENAIKYCRRNSLVYIKIFELNDKIVLQITMTSKWISIDESELIFKEGYSGNMAVQCGLNGQGLGLFFVREMLLLNNINVQWNPAKVDNPKDGNDGENVFSLFFPYGKNKNK